MKKNIKNFLIQIIVSLAIGICGGAIGTAFTKSIAFATALRTQNGWLILLLPVGGLLSVLIYNLLKTKDVSTNSVIISAGQGQCVPSLLTPAIFAASFLSHIFGASVGREGAALQLGGGVASLFAKVFKLSKENIKIYTYCGMAAVFSAVFGTPMAAFIFALEIVCVFGIYFKAVLSTAISSFVAYFTARLLGAHPERFNLNITLEIDAVTIIKTVAVALLCGLLGIVFCVCLEYSKKLAERLFKNEYLRIAFGGILIILLTALVGKQIYNGAGVNIIESIFTSGKTFAAAFLLKMLFTCVSVGFGYKGGEIIPTLFIGASFGATVAGIIGLSVPLGAAVGMTALFCAVTNCPLASILLAVEMFSGKGVVFTAAAAVVAFAVSGKYSLYDAQKRNKIKKLF